MYKVFYKKKKNKEEYIILYYYKPEKDKYAYKYNVNISSVLSEEKE